MPSLSSDWIQPFVVGWVGLGWGGHIYGAASPFGDDRSPELYTVAEASAALHTLPAPALPGSVPCFYLLMRSASVGTLV